MNNITAEGQLDWSKIRRVPVPPRGIGDLIVEPGDILFNHTNSPDLVGKAAYFPGHAEPVTFSNHFLRLRPQPNMLDGRYLARWLAYQWQRRTFQGMCRQWVNQATVSKDHLLALCLPLPPFNEQRRIAAILDAADALRTRRRAALNKLDTLAQSIFIEMFGEPAMNPKCFPVSGLGSMIAEGPQNGL
jgi:type I restriction enzyme S subunit